MEYALEGYGYSWSRLQRGLPAHRVLSAAARARLDAEIDDLAQARHATGIGADRVEAPADLLDALHVRAPASPRAALALEVATSVKSVFDGPSSAAGHVQVTHCTVRRCRGGRRAYLALGAWLPGGLTAEVARGDTVAAGVVTALRGDAGDGGGGAHLDVWSRVFRKICENGAMIHESDTRALQVEPRQIGAGRGEVTDDPRGGSPPSSSPPSSPAASRLSARPPPTPSTTAAGRSAPCCGTRSRTTPGAPSWARFEGDTWTRWGLANAVTAGGALGAGSGGGGPDGADRGVAGAVAVARLRRAAAGARRSGGERGGERCLRPEKAPAG